MFILLEEGMIIMADDRVINCCGNGFEPLPQVFCGFGEPYRKDHVPMVREINTIEELLEAYRQLPKQPQE